MFRMEYVAFLNDVCHSKLDIFPTKLPQMVWDVLLFALLGFKFWQSSLLILCTIVVCLHRLYHRVDTTLVVLCDTTSVVANCLVYRQA